MRLGSEIPASSCQSGPEIPIGKGSQEGKLAKLNCRSIWCTALMAVGPRWGSVSICVCVCVCVCEEGTGQRADLYKMGFGEVNAVAIEFPQNRL